MFTTPRGMNRRHFMQHIASSAAVAGTATCMADSLYAQAETLKKNGKSAIMLWMGGGPPTIDLWDLKPGAATGGPFKEIATSGSPDLKISEHLPMVAKQMHNLAVIRSMSTREADHGRGRYYMHTGYVPNPNMTHPSYGAVLSHELTPEHLEIPPFVSVGGGSEGPGFLGMAYAPFVVGSNGQVRNLEMAVERNRLMQRMYMLSSLEKSFINQKRGQAAEDHAKILDKTLQLMTSEQMDAFKVMDEPAEVTERYGDNNFGRGCMMARRLVEVGVPFIEVNLGGWDLHQNTHDTLANQRLPVLDQAMSALVEDLEQRGLIQDTAVMWMGEFARTPRINGNAGRDHWARSWSVVVGGAGMNGGIAVGATNEDGTKVATDPYTSQDVMATVCKSLGISLNTTFTSNNGRPMKIANSGRVIKELVG